MTEPTAAEKTGDLTERDHAAIERLQTWFEREGLPWLGRRLEPNLAILDRKIERVARDSKLSAAGGGNGHASYSKELGDLVSLVTQLVEQHVALKRLVLELQARPAMKYQGVWDEQKVYSAGDFVTDRGSMWHCWDTNRGVRPGTSDAWQLAVQKGKDGNRGR